MEPEIVCLIPCDGITADPSNIHRLTAHGLVIRLRATGNPQFPFRRPRMDVLAVLAGGMGVHTITVRVVADRTGHVILQTTPRRFRFAGGAADVSGAVFHILGCTFPAAGVYWVECLAGATVIGRQRFWVLDWRGSP